MNLWEWRYCTSNDVTERGVLTNVYFNLFASNIFSIHLDKEGSWYLYVMITDEHVNCPAFDKASFSRGDSEIKLKES